MSINELLDSEADRAMVMLQNCATKPMDESDVSRLGIQMIDFLCEDLAPTSVEVLQHHADIPGTPRGSEAKEGHADTHVPLKKNVHSEANTI